METAAALWVALSLATALASNDRQPDLSPAAHDEAAAVEAYIPSAEEYELWEDRQVAEVTSAEAPFTAQPSDFDRSFDYFTGMIDGEFSACIPAQNTEASLNKISAQVRMALQLLDTEIRTGRASENIRAARYILSDDSEMVLARYLMQFMTTKTCGP